MSKIEFNSRDWEEIHEYLKKWDEWRKERKIGRPDFTSDMIYLVPLALALMKSQEKMEELTRILLLLTFVLALLGIIQLIFVIK